MLRDAKPDSFTAVYIVCGFTDLRLGIDTLAAIIDTKYHLPLFVPGTLFLFCGKRSNKIRGLMWEGDGFLLITKRVEQGRFVWPRTSTDAKKITHKQYEWLMQGFGIDPIIKVSHPERSA